MTTRSCLSDRWKATAAVRGASHVVGVLLFLAMGWSLSGCDALTPEGTGRLVVEAFFETGQPVGPVTLRATQPLQAADSMAAPATGADVTLRMAGQRIRFRPDPQVPGRYRPEASYTIAARAAWTLEVHWKDQAATAGGVAPPPITIDSVHVDVPPAPVEAILVDSLRRDSLDIPAEQGYIYPVEVTVAWTADFPAVGPDSTYWIRAQLTPYRSFSSAVVDFFLQPEEVFRERSLAARPYRQWTGVYAVAVDSASQPLPRHEVRVALVRSGPEYAAFATSRSDPERREPISNIQGALGMAAVIALDSVRVAVGPSTP